MKNSTFAERFSEALRIRDKKPAELSKITDIPESAISNYRNGNYEAKQERVYILSNALNVSPAWLMGYDVPMEPQQSIPDGFEPLPAMARKPIVGDIACGTPILAEENVQGFADVPESMHCDFILRCRGDSMVDAGIQDGDMVYIRIQPMVENGEIAAVRIGNEATLKKFYLHEDFVELRPANTDYESIIRRKDDMNDVHVEGKAVGWTHWIG